MSLAKLKRLPRSLDGSLEETGRLKRLAKEIIAGCAEIQQLAGDANSIHLRVLTRLRLQGEALIEAKRLVGHGHFTEWCEANVRLSKGTVQNWMRVARWAQANQQAFVDLRSVAQLYMLAGIIPAPEQPELATEPAFSLAVAMRYVRSVARLDVVQALALPPEERCLLLTALEPAHAAYEALRGSVPATMDAGNSLPTTP